MAIKSIIFDVGGVITFTDFDALYISFSKRIGLSSDFFENYYQKNFKDMLVGKVSLNDLWKEMKKCGGDPKLDYNAIWLEEGVKLRKVNTELLQAIDKLRKNYSVGILTNLTPTRNLLDEEMDLYSRFDFAVLSFKEKCRKPDPKIYQIVISRAGVKPEEMLFIDDKEEMTRVAEQLGMKVVVYKNNEQLLQELAKSGIIDK